MGGSLSRPFLVTGLPRTRSAWLSVFLTRRPMSVCVHELSRSVSPDRPAKVSQILDRLREAPTKYAGTADSGLLADPEGLLKAAIEMPVAVIARDVRECRKSLMRSFGWEIPKAAVDAYIDVVRSPAVRVFKFDELESESTLMELSAFLRPGMAWDETHWWFLRGLNIQVHAPAYKEMIGCPG